MLKKEKKKPHKFKIYVPSGLNFIPNSNFKKQPYTPPKIK